jgi:hypothetical protein
MRMLLVSRALVCRALVSGLLVGRFLVSRFLHTYSEQVVSGRGRNRDQIEVLGLELRQQLKINLSTSAKL